MKKSFIILFLSITSFVYAVPVPVNVADNIRKALKQSLPEVNVDQVNNSEIPGIYEVIAGRKVFYVDASGRYAMLGKLVNLTTKEDLTQQKVDSLSVVDWNKLPLNVAIRKVIGRGERKLAIFTDPDCQFCKRFEGEIVPKLTNVTVYYFLFPLPIHLNAENNSKRILCSPNPEKTFTDWMVDEKKLPVQSKCVRANDLAQMKQVGEKVVLVDATPTLILPDGRIINGLVPADYLNKLLTDAIPTPSIAHSKESRAVITTTQPTKVKSESTDILITK